MLAVGSNASVDARTRLMLSLAEVFSAFVAPNEGLARAVAGQRRRSRGRREIRRSTPRREQDPSCDRRGPRVGRDRGRAVLSLSDVIVGGAIGTAGTTVVSLIAWHRESRARAWARRVEMSHAGRGLSM